MASRAPRRTFQTPFVITLALPLGACVVESSRSATVQPVAPAAQPQPAPSRTEPAPESPPVVITNPPRPAPPPEEQPTPPAPQPTEGPKRPPIMNPPRPTPPVGFKTRPAEDRDRHWSVYRSKDTCTAADTDVCTFPGRKPGDPVPPCNPPAPLPIKCIEGMADGASIAIRQLAHQTTCVTDTSKCPAAARCIAKQVDCP